MLGIADGSHPGNLSRFSDVEVEEGYGWKEGVFAPSIRPVVTIKLLKRDLMHRIEAVSEIQVVWVLASQGSESVQLARTAASRSPCFLGFLEDGYQDLKVLVEEG